MNPRTFRRRHGVLAGLCAGASLLGVPVAAAEPNFPITPQQRSTAQQVAQAGSGARIIICSGSGAEDLDAALEAARRLGLATAGVLPKPFRLAALRAVLAGTA